jgi:hypothetical protein
MAIESFNDEFSLLVLLFTIWKIVQDLHFTTLEDVHLLGIAIHSIEESASLQLFWLHVEDPLIFDMLWKLFEELNLVETDLKEHFDRIIIHENVFFHQIVQILVYLKKLVVIWPI